MAILSNSNCSEVLKAVNFNFERMLQGNLNQLNSEHICDTRDNLTKEPRQPRHDSTWVEQIRIRALIKKKRQKFLPSLGQKMRMTRHHQEDQQIEGIQFFPQELQAFLIQAQFPRHSFHIQVFLPFPPHVDVDFGPGLLSMWQTEASVLVGIQSMYLPMRSIHFSSPANFWYRSHSSSLVYDKGKSSCLQSSSFIIFSVLYTHKIVML